MARTVLITGASRGIGEAIAREFAWHAYNVVINYNESVEDAINLQEELEEDCNIKALIVKADVSNEEEVKKMVDAVIKEFGTIDVLVNNAGIAIDKPFVDKTYEDFRRILDVNLISVFLTSKYVSPYMLKNKFGRIINISSTNGIDTLYPESMDYDASKAGVISLTHNLAKELAPVINVNAVAPGWVKTDMNKELDKDFIKEEEKKILLERFAEPDEIAKVVFFLASDEASYINSSVIRVDGGLR
jgi:3-oxoacyl-[acyl-carrier protein] reductase